MNSLSRSHNWEGVLWRESRTVPGVRFAIRRVTLNGRIELLERVRELARRIPFLEAGEKFEERVEAALLNAEVERLYVGWGLARIEGLKIEGRAAGVEDVGRGPEGLAREIAGAVRAELGLSEEERKN